MANETIIAIDDEPDILELIAYNLGRQGYDVAVATSGERGLDLIKSKSPDLILLDLMLPGLDGLELCSLLKKNPETRSIPIIMLTARSEETDIITGLEMGAEDYVLKPFSPKILIARIRTALRRKKAPPPEAGGKLHRRDLTIDEKKHEISVAGIPVSLTLTQFRLLHFLARHPGWVFTRSQIVNEVRGEDVAVVERTVDVQVAGLRKKLGPAGAYIETVRGIGYRFLE